MIRQLDDYVIPYSTIKGPLSTVFTNKIEIPATSGKIIIEAGVNNLTYERGDKKDHLWGDWFIHQVKVTPRLVLGAILGDMFTEQWKILDKNLIASISRDGETYSILRDRISCKASENGILVKKPLLDELIDPLCRQTQQLMKDCLAQIDQPGFYASKR